MYVVSVAASSDAVPVPTGILSLGSDPRGQ